MLWLLSIFLTFTSLHAEPLDDETQKRIEAEVRARAAEMGGTYDGKMEVRQLSETEAKAMIPESVMKEAREKAEEMGAEAAKKAMPSEAELKLQAQRAAADFKPETTVKKSSGSYNSVEKSYHLSVDVTQQGGKKFQGDPKVLQKAIQERLANPEGFGKSLSPEQKKMLREVAGQVSEVK